MADIIYPTNAELQMIAQEKIPRLTQDRVAFDLMPMRNVDTHILMWEQLDNYQGLQQVRGLNGNPTRVKKTGVSRYMMQPGVYGEFEPIDETEMTVRRPIGRWDGQMDVTDLTMMAQDKLLGRRLDRIEQIIWALLSTGTFSVSSESGGVIHTDSFPIQTYTALVTWATIATATPLADLRAIQYLGRGRSVTFNSSSVMYMNRTTYTNFISNTNAQDFFGRRQAGLATINNIRDANQLLTQDDLPNIQIYDEGYIDDNGVFQLFIPNGKVIVVGRRPAGQVVGEYLMVRNANNLNFAAGPYMRIIDRGETQIPRLIEVHDGHSGGPALYYPSAILVLNV